MKRTITYNADQRAKAKETGRRLACIQLTGPAGKGGTTFTGAVTEEEADIVQACIMDVIAARQKRIDAAKEPK